ncbi:MAG: DUF512 domain-containing protein [Lachnospiraceae bacterium]|nr:DUF512 domain-containing protein [Lachnospiraceae bacterium]
MYKDQRIDGILPGSIAEELGLEPGDIILSINGDPVEDVLDYRFLCKDEFLSILIRRGDEEGVFEVEKDADEDLGIVFDDGLMDEYHSCCNKCMFCFIDQMPPGMRPTLYFKDDDERLSFLQGNYITLTNLKEHDIQRIIDYHLSPINISVHTMNPGLRCRMLHNRFAGDSLRIIDRFYDAGITMNAQIVLCPGINDGSELEFTISSLSGYLPHMESVSVVPVGLTRFREGLPELTPVTPEGAAKVIDLVEEWQKKLYPEYGLHFIHASDEFYLSAGRPLPEADRYDGYLQLENGVGMLRSLTDDFEDALSDESGDARSAELTIATGVLAADTLRGLVERFNQLFPNVHVRVIPVINHFFGELITVAGLITGSDLTEQLKGRDLGDKVLITVNMLRSGERVFLDDMTVEEAEEIIETPIVPIAQGGEAFLRALMGEETFPGEYPGYER